MYGYRAAISPRFPCALSSISDHGKQKSSHTEVKVAVGPVGNVVDQSFPIERKLGSTSTLVVVRDRERERHRERLID
mgnify:CR=1 FL=1